MPCALEALTVIKTSVVGQLFSRPSKDHEPNKMELQNFIRGRPSQDRKPGNLEYENYVTSRPSKDHEPYQNGAPKFHPQQTQSRPQTWQSGTRNSPTGRPSKDHEPYKLELQNVIRGRPSQDHKPGNLEFQNFRSRNHQKPCKMGSKFSPRQAQLKPSHCILQRSNRNIIHGNSSILGRKNRSINQEESPNSSKKY